MKDNNTLSFKNRRYIQVELVLIFITIFAIIVQAIFFDNKYLSSLIIVWVVVSKFTMPLPYRYTIEGDKLIFKYFLKRNKIINIANIQDIDVAKRKCLSFTYKPLGFENSSHECIFLKDIEVKEIQEELTKRNSNIEVLFS